MSSLCKAFVSIQIIMVVTIQMYPFRSALIVFPVYTSPDVWDVWPNNTVSMIYLKCSLTALSQVIQSINFRE